VIPNIEVGIELGQTISLGNQHRFRLEGDRPVFGSEEKVPLYGTSVTPEIITCTVLVGDIRDYTVLVQQTLSEVLQRSLNRVFDSLRDEVARLGGTVKEYQGDAILAFWESGPEQDHAARACRAALSLDRLSRRMAGDRSIWNVPDSPLRLDWALASGPVSFETMGGRQPTGLSMVGRPVVLAFRLEKLADDETGSILVCPSTRNEAGGGFRFRDLGKRTAKGFEQPIRVHALLGLEEDSDERR
jgi:class 3 adenylate cyclase